MPQSNVLVNAPIRPERLAELRALLASMNERPGVVNPENPLFPFAAFPEIHFARFVILEDRTGGDMDAYGAAPAHYPVSLAFLADFDGTADDFRGHAATRAQEGLKRVFACCEGFNGESNLSHWMKQHETPPATIYGNWRGRTVSQVHEEEALRLALEQFLQTEAAAFAARTPEQTHAALHTFVQRAVREGRLRLTSPPKTPVGWWIGNALHLIAVPLALLLLAPFLLLYLPIFAWQLRSREKSDPAIAPRPELSATEQLAAIEDHDVTNQFTAMGSVKPGRFRRWVLAFLLWVLNWTTRHIYKRGQLARVGTIHFARWVFINDKRRMLFASNYDGSLSTYMDDFINKAGFGLNLVFSNGLGYPGTRWLVLDGSKDEQKFKYFLRRHQLPTDVWYKAYPGLTAFDLKRNTLLRQGLEKPVLADAELRRWVALL